MAEKKEVVVGNAADFVSGVFKIVEIDGRQIGITRLKDGALRAVRNHCPHKGAPVCKGLVGGTWLPSEPGELIYGRDGEILICPWHGYEFDLLTGEELFQESRTKLLMYPISEREGTVVLTV